MSNKRVINDEIVLMRKAVRQSRVAVVRKLIKEAKLLQARKHGDEKNIEKCKRKALRLLAEITAAKKIKDDDISKFGITEKRKLHEILNDLSTEPSTRIMARLVFHKILQDRIIKFKDKFPQYEDYLGPGRKKLSKLQRKTNRDAKNGLGQNKQNNETPSVDEDLKNEDEEFSEESSEENEQVFEKKNDVPQESFKAEDNNAESKNEETNDLNSESISTEKTNSIAKRKNKENDRKSKESICEPFKKVAKKIKKEKKKPAANYSVEMKKSRPVKIISKEATVRRFTDLVEDRESTDIVEKTVETAESKKEAIIEKQVDSFFMTENGESEYMSVVVPRPIICEDEDQDERFGQNHAAKRAKNFNERNNKFFSKIDQRNDHGDKFASNVDKRRSNNYYNDRDTWKNSSQGRNANKSNFEKNIEVKDEELHPSWAARKKQQEILKQGFQGKKIVFDD